jgi:hypothetical protein
MGCRKCMPVAPPQRWPAGVGTSDARVQRCGHYNPGSRSGYLVVCSRPRPRAFPFRRVAHRVVAPASQTICPECLSCCPSWQGKCQCPGNDGRKDSEGCLMSISRVLVRQIGRKTNLPCCEGVQVRVLFFVGLVLLSGCDLLRPNYYVGTCVNAEGKEITRITTWEPSLSPTTACDDRRQISVSRDDGNSNEPMKYEPSPPK